MDDGLSDTDLDLVSFEGGTVVVERGWGRLDFSLRCFLPQFLGENCEDFLIIEVLITGNIRIKSKSRSLKKVFKLILC